MRIAISNIAWDVGDDEAVAALLHQYNVDAIDIAPGKYFPDPRKATSVDMIRVRDGWAHRGIEITGMQALLFGATGLNLFASPEIQTAMLAHLDAVCRIGGGLGATRLVFGSPKNRDRTGLSDAQAETVAVEFFRRLGDSAGAHGVRVCLEPNPPCYGANFMTTSAETAAIVKQVDHPAIRMQLDTGAMTINGEAPEAVIAHYAALIGHVHASEPNLVTLGDGGCEHHAVGRALNATLPDQIVTIEMLAAQQEPPLQAIERALNVAICHYRDEQAGRGAST
ncbi:MAG: sugar phosphate isomerase/epimerase [Candidatus Competibacteraceae bacterium]|nr:MAG: sugar phosphate isomerase/epimerase [Candidatus Competibacteraceae bacterium]